LSILTINRSKRTTKDNPIDFNNGSKEAPFKNKYIEISQYYINVSILKTK